MKLRILVLGYIVRGPLGGLAWHHLQYVLGLARLGHAVTFLEDSDDYAACYDPERDVVDHDPRYGLRFAAGAFDRIGVGDCWAYHDAHAGRWLGPCAAAALDRCADADLLLNLSGVNPLRPWLQEVPARAFVDTDPAFTQIRHLTDPGARALAEGHTAFFTFGENVGRPGCTIPDDGFPWQPTRQPVVLDAWPVTPGPADGAFTTVMQWDSYPARTYGGRSYGMKSASFGPYERLPGEALGPFELALGSPTAPRDRLRAMGWQLRDPRRATRDPWTYQAYLQASKGEFGVAKQGYVTSGSGWFSERTAAYLASGRPAVVQDTGFTAWLPAGRGLYAFSTPDEARAALDAIDRGYRQACADARALVAAHFDARRVLTDLLERALDAAPAAPAIASARPAAP